MGPKPDRSSGGSSSSSSSSSSAAAASVSANAEASALDPTMKDAEDVAPHPLSALDFNNVDSGTSNSNSNMMNTNVADRTRYPDGTTITFNVGGTRREVLVSTIQKLPDSYLDNLVQFWSGEQDDQPFIDRD